MMACFKVKVDAEKNFINNGGLVLEELIALCNGRSKIPISHFSANELTRATNNYDPSQILLEGGGYQLYKGSLHDRPILVKKYLTGNSLRDMPYKDIVVGSQMSVHKNILKVIGYCLETEYPAIVYEFAVTKLLYECIFPASNVEPLPWKCRLKIAVELANAFAYLHTAFARPVVHRAIYPDTIILDENNVSKLIDFGDCISIPEGKSHVEDVVMGKLGFIAPEYLDRGYLTEKTDVYSFGMLLFELLSGQRLQDYIRNDNFNPCAEKLSNAMDRSLTHEGIEVEQLLDFKTLFHRCSSNDEELRPTMTDVGKELRRIYQTFQSPC